MSAPRTHDSPPVGTTTGRLLEHSLRALLADERDGAEPLADDISRAPRPYNPLVICGPSRAGNSRCLGGLFLRCGESCEATLWDGPTLDREIVSALAAESLDRLHARFVSRRLILIDALDALSRPIAQQTLAHLFDAAVASGTRFVVSVAMPPCSGNGLEPALASRLCGGLVIPLPALPARPSPAEEPAPPGGDGGRREAAAIRRVISAAARHYGLEEADLTGSSRRRAAATARSMAMYLSRHLTGQSLQRIGAAFGGRDHTTVMHSLRITEDRIRRDPRVFHDAELLLQGLQRHRRCTGSEPRRRG